MTGFESKRQAAQDKLQDEADTLTIVYQRGFADGKRAAQRKPLTDEQKQCLVTDWFDEDWAVKKALWLLDDYEAAHGIGAKL